MYEILSLKGPLVVGPDDKDKIRQEFQDRVNMAPGELEAWLKTDESRSVGDTSGSKAESTGHKSGRRIIEIKRKNKEELDDSDYQHMRKVINYLKRHLAQQPGGDVEDAKWRYSLMNWGHDPLRD